MTYDKNIDLWSLGCTIYELITGKILLDVDKNRFKDKYDRDLINIILIIEKVCNKNIDDMINLIDTSPRRDYIMNKNLTFKYYKNIKYKNWKKDILITNSNVINILENLLNIIPNQRII